LVSLGDGQQTFDGPVLSFDELDRKAQQKALKDVKRTLVEAISEDEVLEEFLRKLHSRFRENGDLFELVYLGHRKTETEEDQRQVPSCTQSLEQVEKEYILKILNHVHWHLGKACEALGISRPTLRLKMKGYGIDDSRGA